MTAAPSDDRGLLLGDGLFETVLFRAGRPVLWDAHLDRLVRGCAVLALPAPDPAVMLAQARTAVTAAGLSAARVAVRLTWTAGSGGRGLDRPRIVTPRPFVSAAASERPVDPAILLTSTVRRNAVSPASRLKSLSYLDNVLARREVAVQGADEALMLNTDGHLACAAAANLFWIKDDRLHTPALDCGVLDGMMRGAVIATAERLAVKVFEVHAGPDALKDADAVFLTNSLIGVRRVGRLDGRALGDHSLATALQGATAALT
jgi:branched-chain amino acid aminotransferase/4-amino-4-deoxychorismate lyase